MHHVYSTTDIHGQPTNILKRPLRMRLRLARTFEQGARNGAPCSRVPDCTPIERHGAMTPISRASASSISSLVRPLIALNLQQLKPGTHESKCFQRRQEIALIRRDVRGAAPNDSCAY